MHPHFPDAPKDLDLTLVDRVVTTAQDACDRHAHEFARLAAAASELERNGAGNNHSPGLVSLIRVAAESAEANARRSQTIIQELHKSLMSLVEEQQAQVAVAVSPNAPFTDTIH